MIRPIISKDSKNFIYFCQNRDPFSDFYITKNNKRLYLTDLKIAKQVFNECLKRGNKAFIKEESGLIKAILLIVGYCDKSERKYIKVLSKNKQDFQDLFSYLQWQDLKNLFIKSRNNNKNFVKYDEKINRYKPSYILRKSGFSIIAVRDREILLKREYIKRTYKKPFFKEADVE